MGGAARLRTSLTAVALGAVMLLATACTSGGDDSAGSGDAKPGAGQTSSAAAVSTAVVSILPKDGTSDVATTGVLKVSAAGGQLTTVTVKDDKGTVVPGTITTDGLGWAPTDHLETATEYTVDAVAKDSSGRESDKHSTFTTVVPKDTFIGFFTPEDGSTVGVGMEVYSTSTGPSLTRTRSRPA